ncbi:restriction endonuclease subunit S [Bacillus sp. FSL R5-0654]|uniref:restriction endonuclease subunit S n=1 Tax=Bacillus sp. FSL R5-0654 TaxID=2954589 RepID=UPI0030F98F6B
MRIKLKYISRINMGQSPEQESVNQEGVGTPFLQGKAEFGESHPIPVNYCVKANKFSMPNDILMSVRAPVGSLNLSDQKYVIGRGLCSITPKDDVDRDYLWYGLIEANSRLLTLVKGSTFEAVTTEDVKNLEIKIPSNLEEQRIISKFLSKKDKKINDLIISKNKLIDLLEQQRQSIITEAVTKGLNSNVKMKNSGVEWIGDIPEHWDLSKVGYLGRLQNGISKSSDEFGFGSPFISYGDVYKNEVLPKVASGLVNATEKDKKLYSVEYGDVFFTRTSETIDEIGIASTCFETINEATFAGFLIRFRPITNRLSPRFARFYFRSALGKRYFVKEMNLVTRASLSQGLLRNFTVLLPSLEEQEEIASYLKKKTVAIEESITLIKNQIEKLKEYRQSLIYEAVTGKIDVRDMELDEVR